MTNVHAFIRTVNLRARRTASLQPASADLHAEAAAYAIPQALQCAVLAADVAGMPDVATEIAQIKLRIVRRLAASVQ